MPDWVIAWLGQIQGDIVRTLAADLRAGGVGTAGLAVALGALHALTPGHGKAALAAYFLGREARLGKGLRLALMAAFLHVLSGFGLFLVLRFVVGQVPSLSGRGSPTFAAVGYGLIIVAGLVMLVQAVRPVSSSHDGAHAITAGIGLLPCPLTISVLGFAWSQSSAAMVGLVLISLALGISATIGLVAFIAIVGRRSLGAAFTPMLPSIERYTRIIQASAGALIVAIGLITISSLKF
jgi:nickel/cobalt exporter